MQKITKAVFPVAGLGTRFLPVTKASPKEMLPIVDKPLIQYAVEEAIAAGIDEIIFVTSGSKRAIEDHFDKNFELEANLIAKNKLGQLSQVQNLLPKHVTISYVRQQEALGLGHAVLCAKHLVGETPFAVLLADDLIYNQGKGCLAQMIDIYQQGASGVLAIQMVRPSETAQYGMVEIDAERRIHNMIEKPQPDLAPSNLAVVGRYILPSEIFSYLEKAHLGAGGEIQLTDAIVELLPLMNVQAHVFQGKRYDCGSKLGYAQANFEYALRDARLGSEFRQLAQQALRDC